MELSSVSILNSISTRKSSVKETLSDRIKIALDRLSITQAELARKIGVKQQVIQYLCSSKTKTSVFTYKIADALQINPIWLATGNGYIFLDDDYDYKLIKAQKKIPLLTSEQLKNIIKNKLDITKIACDDWLLTTRELGKNSYAITLKDQAMYPKFEESTLIFIDAQQKPKNKDFVIAYINNNNEIIFRQLLISGKKSLLQPLNTRGYKLIELSKNDIIFGVMKEARWTY